MTFRTFLPLFFSTILLMACSPTGPLRFYSGPPQPKNQLATVVVPAAITVQSIDGKEVDSPSKVSGSYEVQLPPGHHLIDFRYMLYWGDSVTGMLVKSKDTGVDADFEAGKTYAIRYKKAHNADQAQKFLTDFPATLVDLSSDKEYHSYVIENLGAALAAQKARAKTSASGTPMPNAETAANADPVKRLKFWWLMANPQQRQEFSAWMKTATENFTPATKQAPRQAPDSAPPGTINGVKIKP